jgi:hypothetical protein
MQSYRIEAGKLAETWLTLLPLGSTWTDAAQEHWTSPPQNLNLSFSFNRLDGAQLRDIPAPRPASGHLGELGHGIHRALVF